MEAQLCSRTGLPLGGLESLSSRTQGVFLFYKGGGSWSEAKRERKSITGTIVVTYAQACKGLEGPNHFQWFGELLFFFFLSFLILAWSARQAATSGVEGISSVHLREIKQSFYESGA